MRVRRICEKEDDYRRHRGRLKTQLRRRGYSGSFVEKELQKADGLNRDDLLSKRRQERESSKRVPLILTYSSLLPDVHSIVHKHIHVLYQSEKMSQIFNQPPLVAFRRDRNLCDTLVHAKTNKLVSCHHDRCEDKCVFCDSISSAPVHDTMQKSSFPVPANTNCRTRNVVYAISCARCTQMVYVGETERQVRERMSEHMRDVRLRREKPITCHFDRTHSERDLVFSIVEPVRNDSFTERRIRENIWIVRLKTLKPNGCNVKDNRVPAQLCVL